MSRSRSCNIPLLVLFDRDGTLVADDPDLRRARCVRPIDGATSAVARLRANGIRTGIVTNQPRIGLGKLDVCELDAIHNEIDRQFGPFDVWAVCPHAPHIGCACRKPMPGLITSALRQVGCAPGDCVVVGDIGSDIDAAFGAGTRAILVPTAVTRRAEIVRAPVVAANLDAAVGIILRGGT